MARYCDMTRSRKDKLHSKGSVQDSRGGFGHCITSGADYARRGSPPYVSVANANGASPGSNLVQPPAVLDVHLLVQKLELVPQTAQGKLLVNAGILCHPEHPLGALGSYHAHGEHCRPTGVRLFPSK